MSDASRASVFLQWKGTDACFDFHCPCGESVHVDAVFAYYVHCRACDRYFRMPSHLEAIEVEPGEAEGSYVEGQGTETYGE